MLEVSEERDLVGVIFHVANASISIIGNFGHCASRIFEPLSLIQGDLKEIPLYRSSNIGIDGGVRARSENRHLCRVNVGDNIQPPNILDGFQARRRKHREVLARG